MSGIHSASLPAARVIRLLEKIKGSRQLPTQIRVDNGPEYAQVEAENFIEVEPEIRIGTD